MIRKNTLVTVLALAVLNLTACGHPARTRQIALTFDDLPVHGDLAAGDTRLRITQSILETLHREDLPPTYGFVNGGAIESDPTLVSSLHAWRTAGDPLGNHTWSHPALSAVSAAAFEADISRNEPVLQSLMMQEDWRYVRYPYLDEGDTPSKYQAVRTWLNAHHYKVAHVTQDFGDYLWNPPYLRCLAQQDQAGIGMLEATFLGAAERQLTQTRTVSRFRYGREIPLVVLLHAGAFDARMLPSLIGLYRGQGYTFVTLQEAQRDRAYLGDPAATFRRGASVLRHLAALRERVMRRDDPLARDLSAVCPGKAQVAR